ncbi:MULTISPECIES: porin family protein [unclassified Polaribacter]|uniref:porin family protein n=1 Tax=unclassified Polaribacter TaxID=196858 RepID=UPI0011BE37E5|nr:MULTISPECIES: porin family protein [unclassified Polaribacter]TXD54071.1 PorT family protein [Polaribacter sp. IC063]TXD62587.1 PorT family protein [Polaribacter sp. IC066]
MMVKKLWVACVVIAFAGTVNAQDTAFAETEKAKDVKLGIKLGMNIASVNGSNANNIDSRTGFVIGVAAEILFTEKFSVQPELLYSAQGAQLRDNFMYDLNYVSLPIMVKYYVAKGFTVEAGPQFSFLLKDELVPVNQNSGSSINTAAENFDLGLNLGLGYQFKSGVFFQTRYNLGLIAVTENPDIKNGVFQMTLGYQF